MAASDTESADPRAAEAQTEAGSPAASAAAKTGALVGTTAGIATLFLLLRLLAVSEWNWGTAGAVADSFDFGDALPIAFGTLFARPELTGALIALLLPLALLHVLWPIGGRVGLPSLGRVVAAVALVTIAYVWIRTFHSWWVGIGALALGGVLVAARLIWTRGVGHRIIAGIMRSVGGIAVIGVLLLAVLVDTPWVSKERLETGGGALEGWVLEVQPGFLKVLTEQREVEILPTADVSSRRIIEE